MSNNMEEIFLEHVNDMCGGYHIAHKGKLSVLLGPGESAVEAIARAEAERDKS